MIPPIAADTEETRLGRLFDRAIFARLFVYARPHIRWLATALVLLPFMSLIQFAQPLIIQKAVDENLTTGRLAGLDHLLVLFAILMVGQFVLLFLLSLVNSVLGQRMVRDIRRDLFAHLTRMDAGYYHRNPSGRLTNRLTNDVEAVSQMMSAGAINLLTDLLLLTGIAAGMIYLSPFLSLITLGVMPPLLWGAIHIARQSRIISSRGQVVQSRLATRLTEEIEGRQVVRLFFRQGHNRKRFDEENRAYMEAALAGNFWEAAQYSFVETFSYLVMALLIGVGVGWAAGDAVSIGTVVAFIEYIRRLFFPIRNLSGQFTTMQAAFSALERIFSMRDQVPLIQPPLAPEPMVQGGGEVVFRGVRFGYGKEEVLKGIDLTVQAGEKVAIVGPTGAGKTSLVKLLNRTFDPQEGRILIDGVDVTRVDPAQLRRRVGIVAQETFLFADTVAGNVGLGDPGITRERIENALEQVGAGAFIAQLPQGLDTPLNERGGNLSTGQRQLLGLARVLAFDPAILVMDEATSSVDTVSERLIQRALGKLLEGRTALIIAHRLSTIKNAHRIVVLSRGRIAEIGTHAQLMEKEGLYARLYALQFKNGEEEGKR